MIHEEAPKTYEAKSRAVEEALSNIEKEYGKGSIVYMGDTAAQTFPVLPTGIPAVDNTILGIGGFPRGRIVEIFGPEAGGKTTLALTAVANAQRTGGFAAYIDVEHALDPTWMQTLGVDIDRLLVSQPDSGEEALRIVGALLESNAFDIIVVDSVAALVPRAELEGDIGDAHVGLQARLMSQALRKLKGAVSRAGTVLLFINQLREKIGTSWGNPETTPGGRALKFYASVRLDIRRIGNVKQGETIIGNEVKIVCRKNRMAAPFRSDTVQLLYDRGFDTFGSWFDKAVDLGIIHKSGSWFSYLDNKIGHGRLNAIAYFTESKCEQELINAVLGDKDE